MGKKRIENHDGDGYKAVNADSGYKLFGKKKKDNE